MSLRLPDDPSSGVAPREALLGNGAIKKNRRRSSISRETRFLAQLFQVGGWYRRGYLRFSGSRCNFIIGPSAKSTTAATKTAHRMPGGGQKRDAPRMSPLIHLWRLVCRVRRAWGLPVRALDGWAGGWCHAAPAPKRSPLPDVPGVKCNCRT